MKRLNLIKPYDDEKLVWNESEGQYELTFEYCKSEFECNFRDDDTLKKRIKKNSRKVYRFIEYRVNQYNKPIVVGLLARTNEGRKFIFDILRTQFESDVETGYNDLSGTPAVNLANGQVIDRNELWKNQISVDAEQIFDNSSTYFGINLGYQGVFPPYFFILFRNV